MDDFLAFIKACPLVTFSKGEALPLQMAGIPTLWAIQSGFVKVASLDSAGHEQFLWIKGRLDVVPSERLFARNSSPDFFYSALGKVRAYKIAKADFLTHAKDNVEIMQEIARSMSDHYDDLLGRLRTTEENTVRNKLIHTLTHLAQKISANDSVDFHSEGLQLTQEDIARLISATRETTAIELKRLKDEQLIDYSRSYFIVHTMRLKQLL